MTKEMLENLKAVAFPNLPRCGVRLAVCGDYKPIRDALEQRGVKVITVKESSYLPAPVARHADMLCCHAAENTVVTADAELASQLCSYGVNAVPADREPGGVYPFDCRFNCLSIGEFAVGKTDALDKALLDVLAQHGKKLIDVRQGYARCSVAAVDERSVITSDRGIAAAMTSCGFEVLLISPGNILLEGYDTGFIGGCCGRLSADRMLFCGDVMSHPDGGKIVSFLSSRGITAECAGGGTLADFGGFVPLCE